MSASRQPIVPKVPAEDSWPSLLRERGYRLFAAGEGRAVIVEALPSQPERAAQRPAPAPSFRFDVQYGLNREAQDLAPHFVLLTEVSRTPQAAPAGFQAGIFSRARRAAPWNAVRSIQPLTNLAAFVAQRAGNLTFFLVRSARPSESSAAYPTPRMDVSAVQIGRSLGLSQPDLEALRVAGLVCELGKPNLEGQNTAAEPNGGAEFAAASQCEYPECGKSPAVRLETKYYCRDHFIVRCYEELDSCAARLGQRPEGEQDSEHLRAFLRACMEHADALTRAPFMQDPLERARLLDIRYTASDLLRRMRRSPRVAEAHPVVLRCETPGRPWQEALSTVLISRFGAMFECEHLVRPEDWLFVERLDTGTRARARMAWRAPAKAGHFAIGLEFLDSENFWGLNWKDFNPASLPA